MTELCPRQNSLKASGSQSLYILTAFWRMVIITHFTIEKHESGSPQGGTQDLRTFIRGGGGERKRKSVCTGTCEGARALTYANAKKKAPSLKKRSTQC